jgi:Domain of Unknown Function (DUF1206)
MFNCPKCPILVARTALVVLDQGRDRERWQGATSRQGALQSLSHSGFGKLLLFVLAPGFAAYAIWRFVQTVAAKDEEGDEKG